MQVIEEALDEYHATLKPRRVVAASAPADHSAGHADGSASGRARRGKDEHGQQDVYVRTVKVGHSCRLMRCGARMQSQMCTPLLVLVG